MRITRNHIELALSQHQTVLDHTGDPKLQRELQDKIDAFKGWLIEDDKKEPHKDISDYIVVNQDRIVNQAWIASRLEEIRQQNEDGTRTHQRLNRPHAADNTSQASVVPVAYGEEVRPPEAPQSVETGTEADADKADKKFLKNLGS